jgi:hypothetical protein
MNEVHHPLHDLKQFLPVGGLNVEREQRPLEHKPAHLKGKDPFRISEHPVEEDFRSRQLEQWLAGILRRPHLVPHVFRQITFHSHTLSSALYTRLPANTL